MTLPITLAAAGAAALINLWLAIRVGQYRTRHKISMGDGGNPGLIARMRAHANYAEYTPFVLILVAAIELEIGTSLWLWSVAAIYLLGRVAHGVGMTMEISNPFRVIGTVITMLTLLGLGLYAATLPYRTTTVVHNMAQEG